MESCESYPKFITIVVLAINKLRSLTMRNEWRETLEPWTDEEFITLVDKFTPVEIKRLLNEDHVSTFSNPGVQEKT